VAKWLAHLPFTSKVAGPNPSENILNATRTQYSCKKSKSQRSAESGGSPQGGLGKTTQSNLHMLLWRPCPSWQTQLLRSIHSALFLHSSRSPY
jgi:hypothetical protein